MDRTLDSVLHLLPLKRWHVVALLSLSLLNAVLNTLSGLLTAATSAYLEVSCSGADATAGSLFVWLFT
jgi:hypothetical protein